MNQVDMRQPVPVNIDSLKSLLNHYAYIQKEENGIATHKIIGPIETFDIDKDNGEVKIGPKNAYPESLLFDEETGEIPEILFESEYLWKVELFRQL